ncbi:unnamed protein product [Parascedosporium putredinis]|uniref:Uncharacterized protein n=1 Tax=Parascedosporium putredinis TaxID=1442378 RepID=A0A9P1GV74_9PEZI|nr:unnamed protein product [Parascedosporium putredinis]CAI7987691.1 unnamed protein product [Parascedosporium putredinis]
MDEFINWDQAGGAASMNVPVGVPNAQDLPAGDPSLDIDLALANVTDDDFGFFALQHFSGDQSLPVALGAPQMDGVSFPLDIDAGLGTGSGSASPSCFEIPPTPCAHCSGAGYLCKVIKEGRHQGYCTSCVALNLDCNLAAETASVLSLSTGFEPSWAARLEQCASNGLGADQNGAASDMATASAQATHVPLRQPAVVGGAVTLHPALCPLGKIGARLSRESIRILRQWLSTHQRHPYPSDEEKDMLQRQTGLTKVQITNWLANARRRGKFPTPGRSTSPQVGFGIGPAIARAVTASTVSSDRATPSSHIYTDDGSGRSAHESSASSVGTSHSSGGSFASAYSHASRGSFGSFGSFGRANRRRRRRRNAPAHVSEKPSLAAPLRTYQCTFCTETFKTKHDWQRHEKSLHLSLERWVCCNKGAKTMKADVKVVSCVFCGEPEPTEDHIESHNYSACQEKPLEGRTFYRKDHLNQHLRLVHNVKFSDWSMKDWKVTTPEIRSVCGFCGISMNTWSVRVDHLAEHFKMGYSMEDWKGDWGFEQDVLNLVENSIPLPRNAYELIKVELDYYMGKTLELGVPEDSQLQVEACLSWFRDLIMSSETLRQQAQFGPLRSQAENRLAILKINGKDNLFEACPLEMELHEFVRAKKLLGLTAMDDELQEEACRIVGQMEEVSTHPSENVANWLIRLIKCSTGWLADFRQRAHLPRSEDILDSKRRPTDPTKIDSTVHNYSRLERELGDYIDLQKSLGIEPTDADLQRQARIIIYEIEDGWNQTAADNRVWLDAFRQRHSNQGQSPKDSSEGHKLSPQTNNSSFNTRRGGFFTMNNAEWLLRFKRGVGILKDGPGLPMVYPWAVKEGGSGFAPPYTYFSNAPVTHYSGSEVVQVPMGPAGRQFETSTSAANRFLETISSRYPRPGRVFCARELEEGLRAYVKFEHGETAADDQVLLNKFKKMIQDGEEESDDGSANRGHTMDHGEEVPVVSAGPVGGILSPIPVAPRPVMGTQMPALPCFGMSSSYEGIAANMDISMTDADIDGMLMQDMDFDTIFEQQCTETGGNEML